MTILVDRFAKKSEYTVGKLYIDDRYFCDTIEDADRGLTQDMPLSYIKSKKIYGKTAIPSGTYNITLDIQSQKFSKYPKFMELCKGYLPRIMDVKGFDGILIHSGNTAKDTYGCLLVGENKVKGQVINSFDTFKKLYGLLKQADDKGEKITITYK